ncbi:MAG: phosphohistidine phosphatase SixA [Alcanivoracaceae bacterium]|nr:phosphohistidine phosphatase SixA [Alcanivoracaceae bacterium]
MRLYIVRHGEAEAKAPTDAERNLTVRGGADVTALWAQLKAEGIKPSRIVSSPFNRAKQTAGFIAAQYPGIVVAQKGLITPDDSPEAVIEWLASCSNIEGLALVSHMPLVAALTGLLTEGVSTRTPFAVGTVACLDMELMAPASGRLLWLRSPA